MQVSAIIMENIWSNIVGVIAVLSSIIVVYLNYLTGLKTQKKNEIYLRKLNFYEEVIKELNDIVYGKDTSGGQNIIKLYHKSFLFANDTVVQIFSSLIEKMNGASSVKMEDFVKTLKFILVESRKDLDADTKISILDYRAKMD